MQRSMLFVVVLPLVLALNVQSYAQQRPTIEYVGAGEHRVTGTGTPLADPYKEVRVFVCVTDPNVLVPDCGPSSAALSVLENGVGGANSNYVKVGASGQYLASLKDALVLGQTVTVVELLVTDLSAPDKGIQFSSAPGKVGPAKAPPSVFTPSSSLGAAVVGLDISGASSTDPKPLVLVTGVLDIPWTRQIVFTKTQSEVEEETIQMLTAKHIAAPTIDDMDFDNPLTICDGATHGQESDCQSTVARQREKWLRAREDDGHHSTPVDYAYNRPWVSGLVRIAGIAQPSDLTGALGTPGALAPVLTTAVGANPDKIVQSFEAAASVAYQFSHIEPDGGFLDTGTFKPQLDADRPTTLITISVIGTIGAITPLSPTQANPVVYYATNRVIDQYPTIPDTCRTTGTATPTCYVAFVPVDRSHFYRHYEAGLRFKLYGSDYNENRYRFPGTADITFGQNEYVTGGRFHGAVMHIGGSLPIPKIPSTYIFGSMDLGLVLSAKDSPQLILTPIPSGNTITYQSAQVYTIPVSQPNRDRYRIGFGVDLFPLLFGKRSTTPH